MERQFMRYCKTGDLYGIKKIIKTHKINIHVNHEEGFRWACCNGHLSIVEYLINLYKNDNKYAIINIHIDNEHGFRWACYNGRLPIVKYLINLYKINPDYDIINIHANNEYGFQWACKNGHKYIIKYLLSIGTHVLRIYNVKNIILF